MRNINEYAASEGFGSGGNRTKFEDDGTPVKEGTATGWEDIVGSLIGKTLASSSGQVDYNWEENTITFQPNGVITNTDDRLMFNLQYPHSALENGNMNLHIHWEQTDAVNKEFTIEYRIQRNGQLKNPTWTQVIVNTVDGNKYPYTSGTLNQITELANISMVGAGISATVEFRLARTDSNVGNIEATFVDAHYLMDTDGSREEWVK